MNNNNNIDNTIIEAKENDLSLLTKEITNCLLKVPKYKVKCTINTSYVTEEDAIILQNDNKGNSKYFKSACNLVIKIFHISLS